MRCNVKEKREKEQIQCVNATLELPEDQIIIWNLSTVILHLLFSFKRRYSRDRVKPIENAIERHQIIGRMVHTDGGDRRPSEERRGRNGNASEEKPLEREHDRRILDLNPLELKRRPHTNQKVGLRAEKRREEREGQRVERRDQRGAEEEGDLSREEGEPDAEEGAGLEAEGIEDVGHHQAEGEGGDHRRAAEVEEEGGAGDEGDGDAGVVREGGGSESGRRFRRSGPPAGEIAGAVAGAVRSRGVGRRSIAVGGGRGGGEGRRADRGGDIRAEGPRLELRRYHHLRRRRRAVVRPEAAVARRDATDRG